MQKKCYWIPIGPMGIQALTKTLRVMRLTALLLTVALMHAHASGRAQNITMSGKDIPLMKVFTEIKKQTGYILFSKKELLADAKTVTVTAHNMPLKELLDVVLENQELEYNIQGKTIILSRKAPVPSPQENFVDLLIDPIKIRIVDSLGNPLSGASVSVKNRKLSGLTDSDGQINLNLHENDVMEISFIGYENRSIIITKSILQNKSIAFGLKTAVLKLDNVEVLSTGYQSISRERATGSFGTLSGEQISKSTTFDLASALEGRIAGVVRGSGNSVTIRGTSTFLINGQGQPLYVIDGYPVEGTLSGISNNTVIYGMPTLNPDNIESITVLKDAAAASIYGARAGNGVIVITTKKAKRGATQLSASADVQVNPGINYDYMHYMSSSKYIDMQWDFVDKNPRIQNPATRAAEIDNMRNSYFIPGPSLETMLKFYDGTLTREQANQQLQSLRSDGVPMIDDADKYINQPGITQRYFLSVGKAVEGMNTIANITFSNRQGTTKNNVARSLDVNIRNSTDLSKWLNMDLLAFITYGTSETPQVSTAGITNETYPYTKLKDDNGNPVQYYRSEIYPSHLELLNQYADKLLPLGYSPLDELNKNITNNKSFNARAAATLNFKFTNWLKFSSGFQYERGQDQSDLLYDKTSYTMRKLYDDNSYQDAITGEVKFRLPNAHSLATSTRNTDNYTWRNQLMFNYTTGNGQHSITALAGTETRQVEGKYNYNRIFGYDPELLTWLPLNQMDLQNFSVSLLGTYAYMDKSDFHSENESKNRYLSYYGNAGYTFMNRYDITASIRWDKSNFFGTNPKYQDRPLWSAGIGWNIREEDFMSDIKWLNRLKLRATYGINGNIARDVSPYLVANYSNINNITGRPYGTVQSPPNASLRWEKVKVKNVGVDFAMFKSKLTGTVEYYERNSTDLLIPTLIEPTYGFSQLQLNAGNMTNKGFEITLNGVILQNKDWQWRAGFTFAYNKNTVTQSYVKPSFASSLASSGTGFDLMQGYPLEGMWSYRFARINENGDPVVYDENGKEVWDKDMSKVEGLVYSGSLTPLYSGGINTSVNWKGFELTANFIYNAGHKMRVPTVDPHLYGPQGPTNLMTDGYNNVWKQPGDELKPGIMPRITYSYDLNTGYRNQYWQYGDDKVISASNIRLRMLTVSYQMPQQLLKNLLFKTVRLRAQVNDLFYIANNSYGIDPEAYVRTQGYRSQKMKPGYSFGLNLSF